MKKISIRVVDGYKVPCLTQLRRAIRRITGKTKYYKVPMPNEKQESEKTAHVAIQFICAIPTAIKILFI